MGSAQQCPCLIFRSNMNLFRASLWINVVCLQIEEAEMVRVSCYIMKHPEFACKYDIPIYKLTMNLDWLETVFWRGVWVLLLFSTAAEWMNLLEDLFARRERGCAESSHERTHFPPRWAPPCRQLAIPCLDSVRQLKQPFGQLQLFSRRPHSSLQAFNPPGLSLQPSTERLCPIHECSIRLHLLPSSQPSKPGKWTHTHTLYLDVK